MPQLLSRHFALCASRRRSCTLVAGLFITLSCFLLACYNAPGQMHQLSWGPYSLADVYDAHTAPLHRTHQHVTDLRSLNLDIIHEYPSTEGKSPRANILIATPFMDAAAYLEKYFQTLTDINYPKELISLAFLVSTVAKDESQDATLLTLNEHVLKLVPHSQYRRITVIQQKAAPSNYSHHQRHQYEFQESRRKELARCRNALLASALVDESWVLWLDVDIVEYSPDLLQILMDLDKDIVVPNCLRSRSTLWKTEGVPYDRNNWMETTESLASQRVLEDEEVLFEGYERDHPTYRQSMADLDRNNQSFVVLDGVGGTFTLIKARVHRAGINFPTLPIHHQIETEGLAKWAKREGFGVYGAPFLIIQHA